MIHLIIYELGLHLVLVFWFWINVSKPIQYLIQKLGVVVRVLIPIWLGSNSDFGFSEFNILASFRYF